MLEYSPDLMGSRMNDEWDDDTYGDQGFDLGGLDSDGDGMEWNEWAGMGKTT